MWVTKAMLVFIFLAWWSVRINGFLPFICPRNVQNLCKIVALEKIPADFCLFLQKNDYICTGNVVLVRA